RVVLDQVQGAGAGLDDAGRAAARAVRTVDDQGVDGREVRRGRARVHVERAVGAGQVDPAVERHLIVLRGRSERQDLTVADKVCGRAPDQRVGVVVQVDVQLAA